MMTPVGPSFCARHHLAFVPAITERGILFTVGALLLIHPFPEGGRLDGQDL
jgi:hypothetical protein